MSIGKPINKTTAEPQAKAQETPASAVAAPDSNRRKLILAAGAAGIGMSITPVTKRAYGQAKSPLSMNFWMFENPQQRPWVNKRIKLYMEQNPHIKVDFQAFTMTDLGKKLSVGFATGTAPDGFISADWLMPIWLSKGLLAPLDITRLGYSSLAAYVNDYPAAFVEGAVRSGKVYGYPLWFYAFVNYLNTRQFKEVGLDAEKDHPQTWEQLGEVAKRLTLKDGSRFTRQGFKFAMHAPIWTMLQFNPILGQCGGAFFDKTGKCVVNSSAGVKAMTIRASIARQYGAEDPADSIATQPLPAMDWLRERASMFISHPLPLAAIGSQNQKMLDERYFRAVMAPGLKPGKGFTTTYGFNFVVSAQARKDKQEALHDMYRFILNDPLDAWKDTAPFPLARKSGWSDNPMVKGFPDIGVILEARDRGIFFPRTVVFNEVADTMHKAVQKIMLNNADIKTTLDEAAAEIDRATAAVKKV